MSSRNRAVVAHRGIHVKEIVRTLLQLVGSFLAFLVAVRGILELIDRAINCADID